MTPRRLPPDVHPRRRIKAIGLMVLATFCFAALDSTAKFLVVKKGVPVVEVTWLRFAGHVAFSTAVLWPFALAPSLRSAKPLVQWLRSSLMIVTTGFNFVALRYLQLDQTVTIFFLTPLVVAALAGPLLDEWIGWHRMVAVVAGLLGVLIVMHPGFGTLHWAMLLALVATFGYALYNLATRYLAAFDPARPDLHAARGLSGHGAVCVRHVAVAARHEAVGAVRLARLLGRARPLAAHSRPSQRAGIGACALHLSRADLDVGRRLSHLRQPPHSVDALGRGNRHRVRALSASPRTEGGGRGRPSFGHRYSIGRSWSTRRN